MMTPPAAGAAPEAADTETGESPDSGPETASVPIDFCGASTPTEGYVGKFKVVTVDSDSGTMDIVCVPDAAPKPGIKAAAAQFDQPPPNGGM